MTAPSPPWNCVPADTGTVETRTLPPATVGWMSSPSVGVSVRVRRHTTAPVVGSSATTPSLVEANTLP